MRRAILGTCITLGALALAVTGEDLLAQPQSGADGQKHPTTQPHGRFGFQHPSDEEVFGPGAAGGGFGGPGFSGGGRRGGGGGRWIDPAQWAEVEAFMKEHSPRRFQAYER